MQEVARLKAEGATTREAAEQVAPTINFDPVALAKMIDEGSAAGTGGQATVQAMQQVGLTLAAAQADRDGKKEISSLASVPSKFPGTEATVGTAYAKHGDEFRRWLSKQGIAPARLSDPDSADRMFRYYITNHTTFLETVIQDERVKRDATVKTAAEDAARLRTPAGGGNPQLPGGGRPEGGILKRLVSEAVGEGTELNADQIGIMKNLGFSDERIKEAQKSAGTKTAMGTPLTFVPTRNAGGL